MVGVMEARIQRNENASDNDMETIEREVEAMKEGARLEMDEMAKRFGFGLTNEEIYRIMNGIRQKVERDLAG